MVLQHDVPVQVWGYEDLLHDVEGSLECVSRRNGHKSCESVVVTSQADGVWSMELPARSSDNICTIEVNHHIYTKGWGRPNKMSYSSEGIS